MAGLNGSTSNIWDPQSIEAIRVGNLVNLGLLGQLMPWFRIIQYENGIYPGNVYAPIKSYLTLSIFSKKGPSVQPYLKQPISIYFT